PVEVVRALSGAHIGLAILVPAMIQACLTAVPDVAQRRYDHLRRIHYGASPLAEQTGLLLSAGRATVGTELRIVDSIDNPVPSGTIGEVVGRGPQMMKGY